MGITAEGALLEGTLLEDEGFVRAGSTLTDAGEVRVGLALTDTGNARAGRIGTVSCVDCTAAGTEGRLMFSGAEIEMTGLGGSGIRMFSSSSFCTEFFSVSFSMTVSTSLSIIVWGTFFNLEWAVIIASEIAAEKKVITPTSKNARIASEKMAFLRLAGLAAPVRFLREFGFFGIFSVFFMSALSLSAFFA